MNEYEDYKQKLEELSRALDDMTLENARLKGILNDSLEAIKNLSDLYDLIISRLIHQHAVAERIIRASKKDYL